MKKYFAFILIAAAIFYNCKSGDQKKEQPNQKEKKNYLPVADYILSEINYVDSLPVGILKYSIRDNKSDTAYIHAAAFNELAKDFICKDLEPEVFEKEFSESSFIDETTQATTFTYATKNSKLELQRVDVLATAKEGTNRVSSIYLEKSIQKNDTLITKKLLWKTKKNFQVVTIKEFANQRPEIEQLKVVWDQE